MLQSFKKFILNEKLFNADDKILLAVSGGVDSVVMCELFNRANYDFGIAHCNFQLRGKESDEDEEFIRQMAEKYGKPLFIKSFDTENYTKEKGISIQMAARELRYDWFEEVRISEGYSSIAVAHHKDDQIETFFINLIRGTGIAGLHGIYPRQGKIIRPLLFSSKKDILNFAKKEGIAYRTDSSNQSLKYLRNSIRHSIIPALKQINPEIEKTMTETILKIRDVELIYRDRIEEKKKEIIKTVNNNILDRKSVV